LEPVEFGGLDNPLSKSRVKNLINNAKYMLGDLPEHEDEWLGFRPSLPDFPSSDGSIKKS
jgi:D-amino-acid dehydrogenase